MRIECFGEEFDSNVNRQQLAIDHTHSPVHVLAFGIYWHIIFADHIYQHKPAFYSKQYTLEKGR